MKRQPENIKDVVLKVFEQLSAGQPQAQPDWQRLLENIFDEKERRHVKLSGRKEQVLFFHVDSPAWLYQLNLKRPQILEKVQKEMPDIQKVYFKIGMVK